MPIILILFLALVCSPIPWPEPVVWPSESAAALLTVAIMGGIVARSFRVARRLLRRLGGQNRSDVLIDFHRFRSRQILWLSGGYVACLTLCGWGWAVSRWLANGPEHEMAPGGELLLLAPFLLGWVASWWAGHWVESGVSIAIGQEPLGLRDYLALQFRRQLALACIPVGVVILGQSATRAWPDLAKQTSFQVGNIAVVFAVLVTAPWLLRGLLGLRPLPAGPLRQKLEATARRLRFRYDDLLLWNTHGHAANAMISGVFRKPRYVLFTDVLLEEMTPDEIEGVLGHEMGHARHRHLAYYLLFLGLSCVALFGLANWADQELQLGKLFGDWQSIPYFLMGAAYIVVVFGFVSRSCEREADLFGCKAVSCGRPDCAGHDGPIVGECELCRTGVTTFIGSLERVAISNGIDRKKPGWLSSWQHGTIAKRVEFLEQVRENPKLADEFQHRLRWIKIGLLVVLAASVALFAYTGYITAPPTPEPSPPDLLARLQFFVPA
ncbi:MAG: M48 family metallopeptidase [Gemmataceae bacterium]